jgi:hypothetical protein
MKRTHYSLYCLIGCLVPGGRALLIDPQLALGIIVLQAMRHRPEALYSTASAVRSGMPPILPGPYSIHATRCSLPCS